MPVPVAPDVTVRKVALLAAVQAHVDAAITAIVPVVAAEPTLVVVAPSVTAHALDGSVAVAAVLFEHAAAARAATITTMEASNSR